MHGGLSLTVKLFPRNNMNVFTIHDNYERPNLWGSYHHVELKSIKDVVVSKTVEERLGEPYNKCSEKPEDIVKDSDLIKRTIGVNRVYSREMCYYLCFFQHSAESFNCSFPHLVELPSFNESCLEQMENMKGVSKDFDYARECDRFCPLECDKTMFTFQTSQFENSSKLGPKVFRLNVDFDEFKFLRTTQFPKTTFADLISKIGGTLGLFIGLKALSFVEIFEFLVDCLAVMRGKMKKKSVSTGSAVV